MITYFGFTNFRKFVYFNGLDLAKINIFVGANDCGKSTFVKALLLTIDNSANLLNYTYDVDKNNIPIFQFSSLKYSNIHVGRYSRARCTDDRQMSFCIIKNGYQYTIYISTMKSSESNVYAVIDKMEICGYGVNINIDFCKRAEFISNLTMTSWLYKLNYNK